MNNKEEIIDLEEVNGIYEQTHIAPKSNKVPNQINYNQYKHIKVTNTYNQQQQQSNINELVYGFNEGLRLINRFMKLIR